MYRTPPVMYLEAWCRPDSPGNSTKSQWRVAGRIRNQIYKFKTLVYAVQRRMHGWACFADEAGEAAEPMSLTEAIAAVTNLVAAPQGSRRAASLTKVYEFLNKGTGKELTPQQHEQKFDWKSC